jgi:hypothetical protein
MKHNKKDYMKKERDDTPLVINWLKTKAKRHLFNLNQIKVVTNRAYQLKGIDLIGYTDIGTIKLENKIRHVLYDDLLIETLSKEEQLTPGWIEYSKADFLVYVFKENGTIEQGHIFDLKKLQTWWKKQDKNEYEIKYAYNQGYRTKNRSVPLKDIPEEIIIYSDILILKNNFSLSHYLRK